MTTLEQLRSELSWQKRRELVRQATEVAVLLAWLPHEREGWVRAALATRLGALGGEQARAALTKLAKSDPSSLVQTTAQNLLTPPPEPSPANVAHQRDQLLQNPDFTQRALLARALGKQGTPEARQALLHALGEEPEPVLCLGIVRALASWSDREVLVAFEQFLRRCTNSGISGEVYRILQNRLASLPLDRLETLYLEETDLHLRDTCFRTLERRGPFRRALCRAALEREENSTFRSRLIQALAAECDDHTRAFFLTLLQRGETSIGGYTIMYAAIVNHYPIETLQALPPPPYDDLEELEWD